MHPSIAAASTGQFPDWTDAGEERRAHIRRVAGLMDTWAEALGLEAAERGRWRAAGILHDSLRDADPET
ncbi:MAG TPA: HD domain-containing protein, partial [Longimicrobiales bacterium]|nr:HD domain-containing protein [Longimicrobiales bacterium]